MPSNAALCCTITALWAALCDDFLARAAANLAPGPVLAWRTARKAAPRDGSPLVPPPSVSHCALWAAALAKLAPPLLRGTDESADAATASQDALHALSDLMRACTRHLGSPASHEGTRRCAARLEELGALAVERATTPRFAAASADAPPETPGSAASASPCELRVPQLVLLALHAVRCAVRGADSLASLGACAEAVGADLRLMLAATSTFAGSVCEARGSGGSVEAARGSQHSHENTSAAGTQSGAQRVDISPASSCMSSSQGACVPGGSCLRACRLLYCGG